MLHVICRNTQYCIPVATLSHLRFAACCNLFVPAYQTVTIGPRAFAVACSKSWNSLPQDIRVPGITQGEFRNKLKTVMFKEMLAGSETISLILLSNFFCIIRVNI